MLLKVDNNSIRRMKSHMLEFFSEPSVGCILGTNGYIWIYAQCADQRKPEPHERKLMAILRNCIVALDKAKLPIYKDTKASVDQAFFLCPFDTSEVGLCLQAKTEL